MTQMTQMTLFTASYIVLWLLVITMAVLLLLVYRHFGLMAMSTGEGHDRDGLPVGSIAPPISGVDRDDQRIQWTPPREEHVLLVFAAPGCEPCEQIAPYLGEVARGTDHLPLQIVEVAAGRGDAVVALESIAGDGVRCIGDDGSAAMDLYDVRATPFGFLLGPDSKIIAKGNCSTPERLHRLFDAGGLKEATGQIERLVALRSQSSNGALDLTTKRR